MIDTMLVALAREAKIASAAARDRATHTSVEVTGMGPLRARTGAQRQIAAGATSLISVGFAGALRAPLGVGDLLLPRVVVDSAGQQYAVDARIHNHLSRVLSTQFDIHHRAVTSIDHVVDDAAHKNALAGALDVDAVDMESAAIASVAHDAGIPFAVLRVICDGPTQRIPHCIDGAVDAFGHVIAARLGMGLALRPWELIGLIRLGLTTAYAGRILERALQAVFDDARS